MYQLIKLFNKDLVYSHWQVIAILKSNKQDLSGFPLPISIAFTVKIVLNLYNKLALISIFTKYM
jgi:hypothetical protein